MGYERGIIDLVGSLLSLAYKDTIYYIPTKCNVINQDRRLIIIHICWIRAGNLDPTHGLCGVPPRVLSDLGTSVQQSALPP